MGNAANARFAVFGGLLAKVKKKAYWENASLLCMRILAPNCFGFLSKQGDDELWQLILDLLLLCP